VSVAAPNAEYEASADAHGQYILCADDYAISAGVSRGIEELAREGRLSAASALVTAPGWARDGRRLAELRSRIAVGLHVNLTAGHALGPMPRLAPDGTFPRLSRLVQSALTGRIDAEELAAEVDRQLAAFEQHAGAAPDFVDGHQHVHALPGVRIGLLRALSARYSARPLLRDPADRPQAIIARGGSPAKAMVVAALSAGFGRAAQNAGFPTNDGFAGFSPFTVGRPFVRELASFFRHPGRRHLIMCHPGYPDEELARVDPVVERRREELETLRTFPNLAQMIWHPERRSGGQISWPGEVTS